MMGCQRRPGAAAAGGAALRLPSKVPKPPPVALHTTMPPRSGRIRIGYLSGDLHMHAVGLLTPELLELHDRSRFEVWAF
jgi:predicted O-linked N-acetylglucosamine transferase (SPINDLY family)